jgi:hypothetical protein
VHKGTDERPIDRGPLRCDSVYGSYCLCLQVNHLNNPEDHSRHFHRRETPQISYERLVADLQGRVTVLRFKIGVLVVVEHLVTYGLETWAGIRFCWK